MSKPSHNPSPSRNAITAKPSLEANNTPPLQSSAQPNDPPDFAFQLWGLRLWILVALVIVATALGNYLANWLVK
jgi:hypothetical protein